MSDLDEFDAIAKGDDLHRALNNALRDLERAKAKTEDYLAAVYRAVSDAISASPLRPVPPPKQHRSRGSEEVALWHLTDWQGAKLTTSYNSGVMRHRVLRFVDRAERITRIQRADHEVKDAYVVLSGDMVEGLFQFPQQVFEVDATIFQQWLTVSHLLVEVLQRALATYDRVDVSDEWGNHGRIGSRRDVVPRSDNFDRMVYHTARMLLADEPRLRWHGTHEDIQHVEIGNYRALNMHSDEVGRTGFVSDQTFMAYLARLKSGGYDWSFQDVYTGHRHRHGEDTMPDGLGRWFRTGSTESDNRYARNGMGVRAVPSQRLHFIDPDKGRVTSQYQVWLDGEPS